MLQGQIEVGTAGLGHHLDQTLGELGGIQIQQPGPRHAGRHRGDEGDDVAPPAEVAPVGSEVLGHQDDLLDLQRLDLGQDVVDRARPLLARETTEWRRTRRSGHTPRPP